MNRGRNYADMIGMKYGRLTVMSAYRRPYYSDGRTKVFFECRCDCGMTVHTAAQKVFEGTTVSCGCAKTERAHTLNPPRHGHRSKGVESPTYSSWQSMKDRCEDPSHKSYAYYGGRGVRVCGRWRDSFDNFLADMGERPSLEHTLDRKDVNGHYEPGNCRWAKQLEQQRNRRNVVRHLVFGTPLCVTEAAEKFGINKHTLKNHLYSGKTLEQAVLFVCANQGLVGPQKQ